MATNNMHNLTTLIKRLEAATSRLEDMASATVEVPKTNGTLPAGAPGPAPTGPLPAPPTVSPPAPTTKPVFEAVPESVDDFDTFINGPVKKYVNLSDEIGGPVAEQASSVLRAFVGQRKFILISTKAKKPELSDAAFLKLLEPLQKAIGSITDVRDANRASPLFNNLSAVSDSNSVLGWITIGLDPSAPGKPHKHVEESLGSAQYYGNRVLKEHKGKNQKHVDWIQAYYQVFKDLAEYAKQYYLQGITWNVKGLSVEEAVKSVDQAQPNPPAPHTQLGGPPPPPPPPPGPPPPPARFDDAPKAAPKSDNSGLGAVFSELNKGSDVTKGLKKVTADQMTHKNPSLRAGATVPTRSDSSSSISSVSRGKSPAPGKKPKPESMRTKKPPVKRLDGNKWIVENFENESTPITIDASISQSILISRCNKVTIMVKGKANAISIDNSPRLSLVVESLVSSIDVIKASNFALQVLGTLPTILMDQVDGATVYLGRDSMNTEVFTSKCSSINLNVIDSADNEEEDADYKEIPLPEQIRTYIQDGKVVSEIVEHAG